MIGGLPLAIAAFIFSLSIAPGIPLVSAQGNYPQHLDPFLNDYAGVIVAEDAQAIRKLYGDLKQTTGVEAVVLTIQSMSLYKTPDQTLESFATHLFNTWGIGNVAKNDGVLVLVSVDDRQMRIELGAGYDPEDDAAMQEVINEHFLPRFLPRFKREDYSNGIYQGSRAVVAKLTGTWPEDTRQSSQIRRAASSG